MEKMGVETVIIRYITYLLNKQQLLFTDSNKTQRKINPTRGIPQGDPTSSLLFCIGVNNLLETFNKPGLRTIALLYIKDSPGVPFLLRAIRCEFSCQKPLFLLSFGHTLKMSNQKFQILQNQTHWLRRIYIYRFSLNYLDSLIKNRI